MSAESKVFLQFLQKPVTLHFTKAGYCRGKLLVKSVADSVRQVKECILVMPLLTDLRKFNLRSLPMGRKFSAGLMMAGTLSSALVGGMLYFPEEPPAAASGLTNKDAAMLKEIIAEEGDATKEAAMKQMFEEWMVKYERRYDSEEEKTMRYREFKRHVKNIEKANALGTGKPSFKLNSRSDSTKAESRSRTCGCREPLPMELKFLLRCDAMYRRTVNWWNQRRG